MASTMIEENSTLLPYLYMTAHPEDKSPSRKLKSILTSEREVKIIIFLLLEIIDFIYLLSI